MSKIFKQYTYLLLFSPLVGYFTYYYMGGYIARQILSYMVLIIAIAFLIKHNRKSIPSFLYPYLIYIAFIYIWKLNNGYIDEKGIVKYLFNNYHLYTALIVFIIYNVDHSYLERERILTIIKLILIVAFLGALAQLFINPELFVRPVGWDANQGSIYLNRRPSVFTYVSDNDYGITVLALFSVLLSFLLLRTNKRSYAFYLVIIGLYSFLTNTRYIMIGFLLVLFQLLVKGKIKTKLKYIFIVAFVFLAGYYVYTDIFGFNIEVLAQKRLFREGGIQYTTRYLAYELFLTYFPRNPIFGTGVDLTDEIQRAARAGGSSQIHVGYFSHLVSYGIAGSLLLFSFWYLLAKDLYKKAKLTGFYGSFFAFLVFLWGNVTFVDYNLFSPGIIIALVFSQYYYLNFIDQKNVTIK